MFLLLNPVCSAEIASWILFHLVTCNLVNISVSDAQQYKPFEGVGYNLASRNFNHVEEERKPSLIFPIQFSELHSRGKNLFLVNQGQRSASQRHNKHGTP